VVMSEEEDDEGDLPKISLHAIRGKVASETMKVYGQVGRRISLVLNDSKRANNFLILALAQLLGLQPEGGGMDVIITSGDKIHSPGKCIQVLVELQGCCFNVDFYILAIERYEVVLGTQWLRVLSPMHIMLSNQPLITLMTALKITISQQAFLMKLLPTRRGLASKT